MRLFILLITASMLLGLYGVIPARAQVAEAGDLIMCPDYSSVYYLADDGTRWVFPNEKTYFTWYEDFSEVVEISCEELASYSIGDVVTYRPGTRLVKIQSINNVYAVEPGGVLRLIGSETQADDLYGFDWASRIDDIPDGFWSSYTEGNALALDEYPTGTVLKTSSIHTYIIGDDDSKKWLAPIYIDSILDLYDISVTEEYIDSLPGDTSNAILLSEFNAIHKIDAEVVIEELTKGEEIRLSEGDLDCGTNYFCLVAAASGCYNKSLVYDFAIESTPYIYRDTMYMFFEPDGNECIFHIEHVETAAEMMDEYYDSSLAALGGDEGLLEQGVESAAQGRSNILDYISLEYSFDEENDGNVQAALTVWYNESEVDLSQFQYISDYTVVDSKYDF